MVHIICVIGAGHSGSTILIRVLGSFPGAVAVGEFRRIWAGGTPWRGCSCGDRFRDCAFWTGVMEPLGGWDRQRAGRLEWNQRVLYRWYAAPFLRLRLRPRFLKPALEAFAESRREVFEEIAATSGANVIVDSSKSANYALALRAAGFDVTTVHLVRDSRGVVNSAIRRAAWGGRKSYRRAWLRSAGKIAPRWAIRCLGADLHWLGSRKKARLRYEDFCAEPARHVGRILRRAGLRPSLEPGQRTFDLPPDHIFLGNRSRHGSGPTTIELDEAWRASIPRPARLATVAMTWPLLLWYGYLWRRPRARAVR